MEYFRRRDFLFCDMCGTMLIMATNKYAECPLCKCKRSAKEISGRETCYTVTAKDIQRDLGIKPLAKVDSNEIDFDHVEVERAKVAEKCRFCGHEGLLCHTMQTRSADEGETVFFECPKCRKTSKE